MDWGPLLEDFKTWFASHDGFGNYLLTFYQHYDQYVNVYEETHALVYTEMHREFSTELERALHSWLETRGMSEEHLEAMLRAAQADAHTDVIVDVLIGMMDYQEWIQAIFALKKSARIAELFADDDCEPYMMHGFGEAAVEPVGLLHDKLRKSKDLSRDRANSSHSCDETLEVLVPEGVGPGMELDVPTPDGQVVRVAVPEGVAEGQVFTVKYTPAWVAGCAQYVAKLTSVAGIPCHEL